MRVLVTGGCGFLGSHLVDRLVERGDDVEVVDSLWTGTRQFLNPGAQYFFMKAHVFWTSNRRYERIYHLASPASPPKYMADPIGTIEANLLGAMRCAELLQHGGRLCFTSTSEVYGDPLVSPLPESYRGHVDCTGPRSSYDESKRCTESFLHEIRRTQGVDIRCARIFNAYGPRTQPDDGRCVSNFITRALQGQPIQVMGDGLQTRCFTYVDCVVEGLMTYWDLEGAGVPTTMNIGLDRETTVLEIAQHVSSQLGVPIEHVAEAPQDPRQRRPDLGQARLWMPGWQPDRVPYEEGIARTTDHFRSIVR